MRCDVRRSELNCTRHSRRKHGFVTAGNSVLPKLHLLHQHCRTSTDTRTRRCYSLHYGQRFFAVAEELEKDFKKAV